MSCLDSLVTTGICNEEGTSISGFTIMQAPGISVINSAKIATETYVSGLELLKEKKKLAIAQLRNDFVGAINGMNVIATLDDRRFESSTLSPASTGTNPSPRGVVIHPIRFRGGSRRLAINSVSLYPLASGDTDLTIFDGYSTVTYNISLVAGTTNVFDLNNLDDFPFIPHPEATEVRVLVDQSVIPFGSGNVICMKGCRGDAPNSCAWADGFDGAGNVKDQGYGVSVNFSCFCDYGSVLCDNALTPELLWLKWQINIFEEQILSNRFNAWVVYNVEQIAEDIVPALYSRYRQRWADMMGSLPTFLANRRDQCFDCRQMRWATSI